MTLEERVGELERQVDGMKGFIRADEAQIVALTKAMESVVRILRTAGLSGAAASGKGPGRN